MRSLELTYTHCYIQNRYLGKDLLYSTGLLCAQSCPTLCHPMDCSPSGSSVHAILQARILGWVVFLPPVRGSSQHKDPQNPRLMSPALAGMFFTTSATWGFTSSIL